MRIQIANSLEFRSGPGPKPFDTLIGFLKEFFEKVNFEKSQQLKIT